MILPSNPTGKPGYFEMSFQVSPPSSLLYKPLPFPPSFNDQGLRQDCHSEAYIVRGLDGSNTTLMQPALSFLNNMRSHDLPPSFVLYRPRSELVPNIFPMQDA